MTKMFYPNPGDTIVCKNGEKYTCVSEKDYPYAKDYPNKAIYGVRMGHIYWNDNSGCAQFDDDYSIEEVIPQNLPNRRVHADLIIAWANGAKIEFKNVYGGWCQIDCPDWDKDTEYRIKPEPKPNVTQYLKVSRNEGTIWSDNQEDFHNLKIIFDGETGNPISVELIGD